MVQSGGPLHSEFLDFIERVYGGREAMSAEQYEDLRGAFMAGAVSTLVVNQNGAGVPLIKQELRRFAKECKSIAAKISEAG